MTNTKKYVGAANSRPDSLVPRRLPNAMSKTKPIDVSNL